MTRPPERERPPVTNPAALLQFDSRLATSSTQRTPDAGCVASCQDPCPYATCPVQINTILTDAISTITTLSDFRKAVDEVVRWAES